MSTIYTHDQLLYRHDGMSYANQPTSFILTYDPRTFANSKSSTRTDTIESRDLVSGEFSVHAFEGGRYGACWVLIEKDKYVYRMMIEDFMDVIRSRTLVDGRFTATLRWKTAGGKYYLEEDQPWTNGLELE